MISANRKWFDRILCPLDFEADSDEGLRYSVALARTYGADLYVCHCMRPSDYESSDKYRDVLSCLQASVGRRLLPASANNLEWQRVILNGEPTVEIPKYCADHRIDLVVLRSRRRTGLTGALGSTAEALARSSPCSILVTGPNEREFAGSTTNEVDPRRILVAYDFSKEADDALSMGLSFAQEFQSELDLLYVLRYATIKGMGPIARDEPQLGTLASRLANAVPAGAADWCKINHVFAEGDAGREILRYAGANPIDLICMGAIADASLMYKVLGSTANRVLRGAPCPVLVAKPLPAHEISAVSGVSA